MSSYSWNQVLANLKDAYATWNKGGRQTSDDPAFACNRLYGPHLDLRIQPKFTFPRTTRVFTIGSCFAREIERVLQDQGVTVPDFLNNRLFVKDGQGRGDGALLNRFNVCSMLEEVRNITDPAYLGNRLLYASGKDSYFDAHLGARAQDAAPLEQKTEVRDYLRTQSSEFLQQTSVMIITLGLSEAIFDRVDNIYLNTFPPVRTGMRDPERFEGRVIDYPTTIDALEQIRARLREYCGPDLRIVVTVSPVGLAKSFSGKDVVIANSASKSVLRAAADVFSSSHDDVDYFPSYEIATLSHFESSFKWDRRHVQRSMVEYITTTFVRHYVCD